MKMRIFSALSALAIIAGSVCGIFAADAVVDVAELSPRATVELIDGEIIGLTGLVSVDHLKSQFDGTVAIYTASGEEMIGDVTVPSDSVIKSGAEIIAYVTVPGDATKDGSINLADASAVLKQIAKWPVDVSEKASDVNKDSKVNLSDVSLLLKYIAKWDVYIFDEALTFPVFTAGRTEYKLLANDPAIDEKIVSGIKAVTGNDIEVITEATEGDRFITVGKDLFEKYDFIDKSAVTATPDTAYIDTYAKNIYLTANSDEGVAECVNYITYKAFSPELDFSILKGTAGHIDDTEISCVDIVRDGTPVYSLTRPEKASSTLEEATGIIENKIKEDFYSKYSVFTDFEEDDSVMGEVDVSYDEILIGQTNRRESRDVYMTLSQGEYVIRMMGNKLVILGYNDDLTYLAACDFVENMVRSDDGKNFSFPSDFCVVKRPYDTVAGKKPSVEIEDISPSGDKLELECEKWVATEMEFISSVDYTDPVYTMDMDAVFYNKETGTAYSVPAFWDGGRSFKVRFALTEAGTWEFYTVCSDTENAGLHHRYGTVVCSEYSGELDIYKHGFVKTVPGKNYFVYDDGTPFFYLADTHWTLPLEQLDGYGSIEDQASAGITQDIAAEYGITSQFKYIMDYRAEQGYTVIQSQPLGWWTDPGQNSWFADDHGNIYTYGVNDFILDKFQQYDKHFAYIAELGLVHANSQFSSVPALMTEYFAGNITEERLEKLCRYWVARYGAYPVMWTTAQEADNDYYGEDRGDCEATPDNNPWHFVIDYMHKYDPYAHPSTCHQEHWFYTGANNSSFDDRDAHTWYAAQYYLQLHLEDPFTWQFLRDYYGNIGSKPVVNYEGRYDHFWVGTYGARAQGWQAFMNGHVGYGYGVQPIWSIFWSGVEGIDDSSDELGTYNRDDNWVEGLYAEAGEQVTYIKNLLENYEWWRLVPCFNGSYYYEPNGWGYSVSTIENDVYLGYFYGTGENYTALGTLMSMKNGEYEVTWLNCRTGEYTESFTVNITDGKYKIPKKPGDGDWVITVEYIGK